MGKKKRELQYRKSMNHNYLVAELSGADEADYQLEMAMENHLPGILPMERRLQEGREQIYYEISSMQPLSRICQHKEMKRKDVVMLLREILELCTSMQEYMLSEDALVLDPDYLYLDPERKNAGLLFMPWDTEPVHEQILTLVEYLMEHTEQKNAADAMWMYQLYKTVRRENCVWEDIKKILKEAEQKPEPDMIPAYEKRGGECYEGMEEGTAEWKEYGGMDRGRKDYERTHPGQRNYEQADPGQKRSGQVESAQTISENTEEGKAVTDLLFPVIMLIAGIILLSGVISPQHAVIRLVGLGFLIAAVVLLLVGLFKHRKKGKESRSETVIEESGRDGTKGRERTWEEAFGEREERKAENKKEKKTEKSEKKREESAWDFSDVFSDMEKEETEDYGKTVFIGETDRPLENVLVEKGKGERYPIMHFPYTIGKVKDCVDLFLPDRSVSRIHARIFMQNGHVYLQDCHSTNGTFLNGIQLEAEEEVLLEKEDEIGIGRLSFSYL